MTDDINLKYDFSPRFRTDYVGQILLGELVEFLDHGMCGFLIVQNRPVLAHF